MQQIKAGFAHTEQASSVLASSKQLLYEALPFVLVRTPLLPFEAYLSLSTRPEGENKAEGRIDASDDALVPRDPRIRHALAIGSSALLDDLERSTASSKDAAQLKGKLLRFLIRMSTRPTPFGLFAGVALGEWGDTTTLRLATEPMHFRTRPDMAWLLAVIYKLEARLDVRKQLRFVTNTAALVSGERVFLAERAILEHEEAPKGVSLRATGVVKRALHLARRPIAYNDLAEELLAATPGATPEKVEKLLTELWQQTFLLTDLRPSFTTVTDNPLSSVVQRLAAIPAAHDIYSQLRAVMEAEAEHDSLSILEGMDSYRKVVALSNQISKASEHVAQVDMAVALQGRSISHLVGVELARAVDLLMRMSPLPTGLSYLEAYRHAFLSRYGHDREVPLLELLHPELGLGSPTQQSNNSFQSRGQRTSMLRAKTLQHLALRALHEHRSTVELDSETLARLETWKPSTDKVPLSLDLYAFVAAKSAEAIDAGEFQVIIGPNIGALAAGRNIGRFATIIGPDAHAALKQAAASEESRAPQKVWAELSYLPRKHRSANVVIRPVIRSHEIVVGTSAGIDAELVIPLDELVVGVYKERFFIRWPKKNAEICITSGHMLNSQQAPEVCRFLAEVSRDGIAQLHSFDWGIVAGFPFLPRIQIGRIVLSLAEWRIDVFTRTVALPADSRQTFRSAFEVWKKQWMVPRYVYLSSGDNRLLLNLEDEQQIEELRTEIRRMREGGQVTLQEALPGPEEVWLKGPEGHYMLEITASFLLQRVGNDKPTVSEFSLSQGKRGRVEKKEETVEAISVKESRNVATSPVIVPPEQRIRAPGSDWLFIKLYCAKTFEEDVIAYQVRQFAGQSIAAGMAERWFFLRYADSAPHIRLRFQGDPSTLTTSLLPRLCTWANSLMEEGLCSRFSLDTYEREIERYGGEQGCQLAEALFAVDSLTVADLHYLLKERSLQIDRTNLAVLSVDNLLASLGLTKTVRLSWLKQHVITRNAVGQEYRKRKNELRTLLEDVESSKKESTREVVAQAFARQNDMLALPIQQLRALGENGELSQPLDNLYSSFVHMHCNRLLGLDRSLEQRVLGLLLRTREGLEASGQRADKVLLPKRE